MKLQNMHNAYIENKHKYIKLCELIHDNNSLQEKTKIKQHILKGGEFLRYPPDFTNTTTYQNSYFVFPHDSAMQSTPDQLVEHFFRPDYIIPAYIRYSNPNFNGNVNDVISVLKTNDMFKAFGAAFIYVKSLIEKIDNSDLNIIPIAFGEVTNSNYSGSNERIINGYNITRNYFAMVNVHDFIVILDTICNVIQNIIIHTIRFVSINMSFPMWYSYYPIINIAEESFKLINSKPKLMVGIHRNYPIYFGEIIPIITNLKKYSDDFNGSNVVENW